MNIRLTILRAVMAGMAAYSLHVSVYAQYTSGDSLFVKDSYATPGIKLCKNIACTSFSRINLFPDQAVTPGRVTDTGLTGNWWGDEIGWIDLGNTQGNLRISSTTGRVTGYAWSTVAGWINFGTTSVATSTSGVWVDSAGVWHGSAYVSGNFGGWIQFDCGLASPCVTSAWVPLGARASTTATSTPAATPVVTPSAGGGGSGGSVPLLVVAPSQGGSQQINTPSIQGVNSPRGTESAVPSFPSGDTNQTETQGDARSGAVTSGSPRTTSDAPVVTGQNGRVLGKEIVQYGSRVFGPPQSGISSALSVFVGEKISFAIPHAQKIASSQVTFVRVDVPAPQKILAISAKMFAPWFAPIAPFDTRSLTTDSGYVTQSTVGTSTDLHLLRAAAPETPGYYNAQVHTTYKDGSAEDKVVPVVVHAYGVVSVRSLVFTSRNDHARQALITFSELDAQGTEHYIARVTTNEKGEYQAVLPRGLYVMRIVSEGAPEFVSQSIAVNADNSVINYDIRMPCTVRDVFGCAPDAKAAALLFGYGLYSLIGRRALYAFGQTLFVSR